MSVEDSESRRLELNIWLSFSQADLGPTYAQQRCFFVFFSKFGIFFVEICAYSERYRNRIAGIFEIQRFFVTPFSSSEWHDRTGTNKSRLMEMDLMEIDITVNGGGLQFRTNTLMLCCGLRHVQKVTVRTAWLARTRILHGPKPQTHKFTQERNEQLRTASFHSVRSHQSTRSNTVKS